jgi:YegS/Rv2252/BmrU family lipid kinase
MVLLNPKAASGRAVRQLSRLRKRFAQTSHEFVWSITKDGREMRARILQAGADSTEAILLIGGDGTVHEALPAIEETGLPFALLPCGRGNDFARNIGISTRLDSNLPDDSMPLQSRIDLPTVNGRPFVSIACLGFDAMVNRLARDGKGYFNGSLGYVVCVIKALRKFEPFAVELRVDDSPWRGRVMMIAVANGPYYGGGMKIAPAADLTDGTLDICIVKEVSKLRFLNSFPRVFHGRHTDHPQVVMLTGKKVEVSTRGPQEIFADGEFVARTPAQCIVGSRSLQIIRWHSESTLPNEREKKVTLR